MPFFFCSARVRSGVALLLVLITAGCATHPDFSAVPVNDTLHTIHYIYRDWHTSVMLDATTYRALSRLPRIDAALNAEVEPAGYVRVGWGDGDYYTGKSTSVMSATRALIASPYSAIQVIGYTADPFERIPAETRVELHITEAAMRALVEYLDESFARAQQDALLPLPAYVENSGVFFEASQRYGLFRNCNTWSSEALRAAGLPIRSALHLTAQSVFEQARQIAQYQQQHSVSL
ncbi:MAG: hypothetical protein RLZZ227_1133 [Pseudomonadota bacterium]|jgi:uncharacterized protein (TIGR02117 family)